VDDVLFCAPPRWRIIAKAGGKVSLRITVTSHMLECRQGLPVASFRCFERLLNDVAVSEEVIAGLPGLGHDLQQRAKFPVSDNAVSQDSSAAD
jgi:hypothetical protein